MLYYGDRTCELAPARVAARALAALAARGPGRVSALRGALVGLGELWQALADAAFAALGHDEVLPGEVVARDAALAVAAALWAAWRNQPDPPAGEAAVERLARSALPPRVRATVPEGHAHYALYPEAYGEAARGMGLAPALVIGLRSIGAGLAAMVAAASGCREVVTLRPVGHPYDRRVRPGPGLAARLRVAAVSGRPLAVVDEGPGASGSSFAAALRWLEEAGARAEAVVLFPGHGGGPGPAASPGTRERWDRAERRVVSFEEVILPRLAAAGGGGGAPRALEDLSAGRWRGQALPPGTAWPPVFAQQERRKYLARGRGPPLLLRFAGLGHHGEAALVRARRLAAAGLAPPVTGLWEGFLAAPWVRATPLPAARLDRAALLQALAAHLAGRGRALAGPPPEGAGPAQLLELVRVNAAEALGAEAAAEAAALVGGARQAGALPRVAVDAKPEPWEWLVTPAGRLLKADAVDHAFAHDLLGGQPAAFDLAGLRIELGLAPDEVEELAARAGLAAPPAALEFLEAAYLAHRLGRWTFALQAAGDPAERARIAAALARYRELLRVRLVRPAAPVAAAPPNQRA